MRRLTVWLEPVAWILLCLTVGGIGSIATSRSVSTWYLGLAKPAWNPPSAVFAPVWTALYILMGVAVALVRRAPDTPRSRPAIVLFLVQLALNGVWSFVFFWFRRPGLSFLEITLLWIVLAATIASFARVRLAAAVLLAPYLAWVSFAWALNLAIWRLNA